MLRLPVVLLALGLTPSLLFAQRSTDRPAPVDPVVAERLGRELVAGLRALKPAQNSTNTGRLKIRDADGDVHEFPLRLETTVTPTNWSTAYQILPNKPGDEATRLIVTRSDGQASQYWLRDPKSSNASGQTLAGPQTMVPFAGSDFWVADLGLEFLAWPKQWVLRTEMRRGQPCDVLESVTPQPAPGGYARVVAWIDRDSGGVLHADAYDARGELMKEFDPSGFKKVAGQYELRGMEIANRRTHSRTWISFDLEH